MVANRARGPCISTRCLGSAGERQTHTHVYSEQSYLLSPHPEDDCHRRFVWMCAQTCVSVSVSVYSVCVQV